MITGGAVVVSGIGGGSTRGVGGAIAGGLGSGRTGRVASGWVADSRAGSGTIRRSCCVSLAERSCGGGDGIPGPLGSDGAPGRSVGAADGGGGSDGGRASVPDGGTVTDGMGEGFEGGVSPF